MTSDSHAHARSMNLTNVLILLGIIVTTIGLVYFATAFRDELTEWGKLAVLVLFTIAFIALGRYFEGGATAVSVLDVRGLRWVRVPTALYVLGGVGALTSTIFFTTMDDVSEPVKVLVTVLAGLALIGSAAALSARSTRGRRGP